MDQFLIFLTNHWILWLAFVVISGLLLGLELNTQLSGIPHLTPQQVVDKMNHAEAVVIDVRDKKEFVGGHIINAINIPSQELEKNKGLLEQYKLRPVVIVGSGANGGNATAAQLRKLGFSNVSCLKDGLLSWRDANLPLIK